MTIYSQKAKVLAVFEMASGEKVGCWVMMSQAQFIYAKRNETYADEIFEEIKLVVCGETGFNPSTCKILGVKETPKPEDVEPLSEVSNYDAEHSRMLLQ